MDANHCFSRQEPSPQPANIQPTGRLWGQHEIASQWKQWNQEIALNPPERSLVSFLDCRRPLREIKVVLCHGTAADRLPMVGLRFDYADGSLPKATSVGPTSSQLPTDAEGVNGHPWCWCVFGSSKADEQETKPHITEETFEVGNARLHKVYLWLNTDGALSGMQFVATNGRQSPRWGYRTDGEPAGSIDFDREELAVGLKIFVNYLGREVTVCISSS